MQDHYLHCRAMKSFNKGSIETSEVKKSSASPQREHLLFRHSSYSILTEEVTRISALVTFYVHCTIAFIFFSFQNSCLITLILEEPCFRF